MRSRAAVVGLFFAGTLGAFVALASCGARTGLVVDNTTEVDGGSDVIDAARDGRRLPDVVSEDAIPPIDARRLDVMLPNDCPDAASTLIYVVSQQNELMSFYPPTATFTDIGFISCPTPDTPFSMAVDRKAAAYSVFSPNGELFRLSTLTASCSPIPSYFAGQSGFVTFGMGFVADLGDGGETLYLAQANNPTDLLGTLDTRTFTVNVVGPLAVTGAELTGTGDGRLFAYATDPVSMTPVIAQLDPATGAVLGQDFLPGVPQGAGWAFGFWGGNFYIFHTSGSMDPQTVVTRFNPMDKSVIDVGPAPPGTTIVGAGVSTCAPTQ